MVNVTMLWKMKITKSDRLKTILILLNNALQLPFTFLIQPCLDCMEFINSELLTTFG